MAAAKQMMQEADFYFIPAQNIMDDVFGPSIIFRGRVEEG